MKTRKQPEQELHGEVPRDAKGGRGNAYNEAFHHSAAFAPLKAADLHGDAPRGQNTDVTELQLKKLRRPPSKHKLPHTGGPTRRPGRRRLGGGKEGVTPHQRGGKIGASRGEGLRLVREQPVVARAEAPNNRANRGFGEARVGVPRIDGRQVALQAGGRHAPLAQHAKVARDSSHGRGQRGPADGGAEGNKGRPTAAVPVGRSGGEGTSQKAGGSGGAGA